MRTRYALALLALVLIACAEEAPPPAPLPLRPARPLARRPPPDAYIGEIKAAWVWPGADGSTVRCIEIRRSWQWDNAAIPTGWEPPPIEPPEPDGVVVLGCELYLRGRRYATCTVERPSPAGWGAPPEVEAEETETRYYPDRVTARAGREACEGEWVRAPR